MNNTEDTKQQTHYICTGGCGGVSSDPQAHCQAPDCPDFGKPLQACGCTDGKHGREE